MPEQIFYKAGRALSYRMEAGIRSLSAPGLWEQWYLPFKKTEPSSGTPLFAFSHLLDAQHFLEGFTDIFYTYQIWEGYTTQSLPDVPPRILNACTTNGLYFWDCVLKGIPLPNMKTFSYIHDHSWDTHETIEGTVLVLDFTITKKVWQREAQITTSQKEKEQQHATT